MTCWPSAPVTSRTEDTKRRSGPPMARSSRWAMNTTKSMAPSIIW
jgi:hypothetical protein